MNISERERGEMKFKKIVLLLLRKHFCDRKVAVKAVNTIIHVEVSVIVRFFGCMHYGAGRVAKCWFKFGLGSALCVAHFFCFLVKICGTFRFNVNSTYLVIWVKKSNCIFN